MVSLYSDSFDIMGSWDCISVKMANLMFLSKETLVLRIRMRLVNLEEKILRDCLFDESNDYISVVAEGQVFTDREFIKRIWRVCAFHGYIDNRDDAVGNSVDKVVILV